MRTPPLIILFLLGMVSHSRASRSIFHEPNMIENQTISSFSLSSILALGSKLGSTTVTCESEYGFLPCTTEVWGQLFLILVYEYLLSLAQRYVSSGSDLFFKMFGSGILGASVFQILGTIPQVAILLVNGIAGSTSTAEDLTAMGLAMLAGSTVMNLTLVWGSIVAFGSYDISKSKTTLVDSQASTPLLTKETSSTSSTTRSNFSLTGYGVTTDDDTTWTARIMLISMIPFIILQLPQILDSSSSTRIIILITLIVAIIFWLTYCIYQVFQPWIQNRRLDYILMKFVRDSLLECLLDPHGEPNESNIKRLFGDIDKNKSGTVSKTEVEALFYGIHIKEVGLDAGDYVARIMQEFDISQDDNINEVEFVKGMKSWLQQANNSPSTTQKVSTNVKQNKSTSIPDKSWFNYTKAGFLVVIGTAISVLLAEPLMENIRDLASAINTPSFIISYIVVPLAMTLKPAIISIKSARQKTETAISLTLSTIYDGVFMKGMMSLTMFLLIYYVRDLAWNVSAGILLVLIVGLVMGFLTSFTTKFPFWLSIFAISLYPVSIGLIYVLITYCGWS